MTEPSPANAEPSAAPGTEGWVLAWALGAAAFGGASLLVPLYIVQLGAGPAELGILAAMAAFAGVPGAILFGRLASHVGHRRSLVLVTLGTVTVVLVILPFLQSIPAVIAANTVLWLVVAAVGPVVTMLVVADRPESAWSRQIGRVNKFQGYGWAAGLVLGTVVPLVTTRVFEPQTISRLLFFLLAGLAAASTIGAARTLPRPAGGPQSEREIRRIARLVERSGRGVREATFAMSPNRIYWSTRAISPGRLRARLDSILGIYLLAAALFFTGFAMFWAPLPHLLTAVGLDAGRVFALYLVSSLGSAVLYEGVGTLADRLDVRLLQSGALLVRGLLFPLVALLAGVGQTSLGTIMLGVLLAAIGLTWAVILVVGTTIVSRLATPGVRGEVLGSYTALGAFAGGIGSVLGGWLATFGYVVAFATAGGLVVAGAVLVGSLRALSARSA
ncbi:MFS transporter [Halodesulfurarchaeum sp. HSR-GB]|uniref:MFS transporter n=1 Tax=Halodesulfurarchaeum sp. HSR-GB TaxID=3074077 RepID=UPI002862F227|nr:MFS transporter [Halodesulfurarchaeum sp. HSR-GB]MDR5655807.1 MFS transporter [Halodesulfurarchaeum sp. HSR-GB]